MIRAVAVLGVLVGVLGAWYATAQPGRAPAAFELLRRQERPPVSLFVHTTTGTCFVAYHPGGLVVVPREVCDTTPAVPPIVGPPVSPEQ